ncbi:hypothetical protein BP6252_06695 [Coleophoma cylindrospora]|uniref:F-box domain-containing protein n=1 Tax=Coleophoma cylindrospora TaxID=1849047 RepID=A0A3D8RFR7_9HELO|nr:hypothetical protein BP6252_06695 [Coleophoma cylindrospora]
MRPMAKVISPPRKMIGDLPDEILTLILEALSAQRDLSAMCLVSRRMNSVADPVLYRSILFNRPKHHLTFSKSLVSRPRRGSLIQDVHLEYPSSKLTDTDTISPHDSANPIDHFSHTISTMSNLEKLVVSVPESLCRVIGTLFNGPFDLPSLKICSLFYQREDDGYWDLHENIHIFAHPTLETLTIRKAKLDERGFDSSEKPSETALKELRLLECDINDDALSDILLLPEALKEIVITQSEVPSPPLEESPDDIEDYIHALLSAQHSLEIIAIDSATLGAANALKLRDFENLKLLRLRDFQLLGQSGYPRLHSVGLPPSLETLEFLNQLGEDEEVSEILCYTIENQDILSRKLCQIVASGGKDGLPPQVIETCKRSTHFRLKN